MTPVLNIGNRIMKLYHHPLSGHSHRARLFLSLLAVPHDLVEVDLAAGAHKKPEFLALNPFGQVPVLDDDGVVVSDSNAILVYLARKLGRADWLPEDAQGTAAVQRWLSVAAGEVAYGPAAARLVTVFGSKHNPQEVIARAHGLLKNLESHLVGRDWLVGGAPTIADVALYSYVARAPEGNVDLSGYPGVIAFLRRIEALPGFVPFVETPVGLSATAA
ncbi:glutathione S-transferase [Nitrospirillum amazonense]|uniref:Glutathione S-transferase n=2 Tax=Nitrospirillum amazonense TaxID=28077 RepID=A0A560JR53_9PROT|nr:glutathione S-transferase [Nitrospirillum amazonense]